MSKSLISENIHEILNFQLWKLATNYNSAGNKYLNKLKGSGLENGTLYIQLFAISK